MGHQQTGGGFNLQRPSRLSLLTHNSAGTVLSHSSVSECRLYALVRDHMYYLVPLTAILLANVKGNNNLRLNTDIITPSNLVFFANMIVILANFKLACAG